MRDIPNIMLTFVASFNAHCEVRSFVISEKRNERRLSGAFFYALTTTYYLILRLCRRYSIPSQQLKEDLSQFFGFSRKSLYLCSREDSFILAITSKLTYNN